MKAFPLVCWIFLIASGCDALLNNQKKSDSSGPSGDALALADDDFAGGVVSELIDAVASSMVIESHGEESGGTAVELTENLDQRSCKNGVDADVGAVTVVRTEKNSISEERTYLTRKANIGLEKSQTGSRRWSKKGEKLRCDADGLHVDLSELEKQGLKVDDTFDYDKTTKISVEFTNRKTTIARARRVKASGTRSILWQDEISGDGKNSVAGTLSIVGKYVMEIKNRGGSQGTFSATVLPSDGEGPVVSVGRSLAANAIVDRTIQSGKLGFLIGDAGPKFMAEFDAVRYTHDSRCLPISGTVKGNIYAFKDATVVSRSYVVDFSKELIQVVFSNGGTFEYLPEGCDFEIEP
jgi:hypothetical protein